MNFSPRNFLPVLGLVLGLAGAWPVSAPAAPPEDARAILHMLEYVGADYRNAVHDGQVRDQNEYQEQQEFAAGVVSRVRGLPDRPDKADLVGKAAALAAAVERRAPAEQVTALSAATASALIQAYQVPVAPSQAPAVQGAAAVFQNDCAACHGVHGAGDGPAAEGLTPKPTNFRAPAWQADRTVYGLYNSISLGVEGTAMRGFERLSEEQRWALAFYVSMLADGDGQRSQGAALWSQGVRRGFRDLGDLTAATPAQVRARFGEQGAALFAYLRAHPDRLAAAGESRLTYSMGLLDASAAAYAAGDRRGAEQKAVSAYLEGFELVESGLRAVDADLTRRVETGMANYRGMIRQGRAPEAVAAQARALREALAQAAERLDTSSLSPGMSFVSSLIILLREGMEAILVLAAIAAFLVKSQRRDGLPYVHAGWIAALAMGGVTWFVASRVVTVSGASREMTEGVSALVASAMLLYIGYWLHTRSHARQWQAFVHDKVKSALDRRTLWGLALIAFLAVYREVFETVLFYQTLWLQTGPAGQGALVGGLAAAAVLLVGIAWLILRFSVRLPLRLFFTANAALLFVLAVVLAGKGVAALQEAGKLPIDPVRFPSIDFLGVYPSLQSLLAQVALVSLALTWLGYHRLTARE